MTREEKIKTLDAVSDVFFELRENFEIGIEMGYDNFLDVEDEYGKIISKLHHLSELNFRIVSKVRIGRNVAKWDSLLYKKSRIEITNSILGLFPNMERRLKTLIPKFDIKYRNKFVLLGLDKGLALLPLFESDSINKRIDADSKERMRLSGYNFTSYERDREKISSDDNVKIDYVMINVIISIRSPDKIKRFKWF